MKRLKVRNVSKGFASTLLFLQMFVFAFAFLQLFCVVPAISVQTPAPAVCATSQTCAENLENTFLQNANIKKTTFQDTNFKNTNLKNFDLQSTNLQNDGFVYADLKNIFLQNTNLQGSHLQNADLRSAGLQNDESKDLGLCYVVTANSAWLYQRPNLASQKIGAALKHKTEIQLSSAQKVADESGAGFWFYQVQQSEQADAYVLCDLVAPKAQTLQTIPNYNAKTNSACALFEVVVDDVAGDVAGNPQTPQVKYQESGITLQKGTRIFLYQGYNRKSKFTAVCLLRDNQIIYGFLQTEAISPDGINPLIITCITLILAALGIIFAWMFMKHRKNVKLSKKYDVKLPKDKK